MKSSSISLVHVPAAPPGGHQGSAAVSPCEGNEARSSRGGGASVAKQLADGYLINLIDSPGHVDFCSEV